MISFAGFKDVFQIKREKLLGVRRDDHVNAFAIFEKEIDPSDDEVEYLHERSVYTSCRSHMQDNSSIICRDKRMARLLGNLPEPRRSLKRRKVLIHLND